MEQNTPDGLWWLDTNKIYSRVGGRVDAGNRGGLFYLYLGHDDPSTGWSIGDPDGFWYGGTKKYARVGGCDNIRYLQNGYSFLDLINNPGGYGWDYGATKCSLVE